MLLLNRGGLLHRFDCICIFISSCSLMEAYGPYPSFDDMGWYGLSYTRIHEVLGNRSTETFLQTALDIFNWCWETGWDHSGTCQGGFWFDNTFNTKQTITNVQMLQLAARLYRLTGNKDILQKLNKISLYISANGLIDPDTYLVADGALPNCTSNKGEGYTYNSGVMIGALTELYKITNKTSYLDIADKMGQAVIRHYCNSTTGILVEPCEPNCDNDALMFKGIFVRYLRYFMDVLPDKHARDWYQVWLDTQVKYNTANNICDKVPISKCNITFQDGPPFYNITGPVFSPHWQGPFTVGAPMQQTSVLDLFVSAIKPETRCQGPQCSYDPHNPSPQPLTCSSHPCPDKMDCCEYSPYTSFTCCAMGQTCNKKTGICE